MRRILLVLAGGLLLALAASLPAGAVTAPAHHPAAYAFRLLSANTAVSPAGGTMAAPGDWIAVTGGGTFTPATGAVRAGGGFTHYRADGTVHCQGTWSATALTGWTDLGGRNGHRAGVIAMTVTHYCTTMGEVHPGLAMTVTVAPRHDPGHRTGVTVAEFTDPTGGAVNITGPSYPGR